MGIRAFDPISPFGAVPSSAAARTSARVTGTAPSAEMAATVSTKARWLREPLLHFLLLGALLYGATRLFAASPSDVEIVIDAPRVARLAKLYELQTGTTPDAAQRERLVQSFLREEMVYREARKHGLDEGDEMVRRRLVQKMEFLQAAASTTEPSDNELRALLAADPGRFAAPARVTFEHRYFSPDKLGSGGARDAARAALATTEGGSSPAGNPSPLLLHIAAQTREEVALAFGQRPIVDAVFSATPGVWAGPVESGFGWHLIRVIEVSPAAPSSFEQARPALLEAWRQEARRREDAAWIAGLQRHYRVVRADRGTAQQ